MRQAGTSNALLSQFGWNDIIIIIIVNIIILRLPSESKSSQIDLSVARSSSCLGGASKQAKQSREENAQRVRIALIVRLLCCCTNTLLH